MNLDSLRPGQRSDMEQSDLYLLQNVPSYHLQALVKARRLPYSFKGQNINAPADPSKTTAEIAGLLFWSKQTSFVGRDYAGCVYDGVLIVPQGVMEAANEVWRADREAGAHASPAEQESGENKVVENAAAGVSEGIRALQRNLYLYWSLVAAMREGLSLVNNRLLSRSALRQVVDQLSPAGSSLPEHIRTETDLPQLLFTRLLLMKLGLLVERSGTVCAMPADAFFSLPLFERARHCYHMWLVSAVLRPASRRRRIHSRDHLRPIALVGAC